MENSTALMISFSIMAFVNVFALVLMILQYRTIAETLKDLTGRLNVLYQYQQASNNYVKASLAELNKNINDIYSFSKRVYEHIDRIKK